MLHTKYTRLHQLETIVYSITTVFTGVVFMLFMIMCFA